MVSESLAGSEPLFLWSDREGTIEFKRRGHFLISESSVSGDRTCEAEEVTEQLENLQQGDSFTEDGS
jgi:hypothetical protein